MDLGNRVRSRLRRELLEGVEQRLERVEARADAAAQRSWLEHWRGAARRGEPLPPVHEVGFRVHSQSDEDGILLYLFALVGEGTRTAIEIGAGDGRENNTANLLLHHHWSGVLFEGDAVRAAAAQDFFARQPGTALWPPQVVAARVTRGNINELVTAAGGAGEVDLLSIDVDGVDYWLWAALEVTRPRVVVIEFNDVLGPERSVTVPYSDAFDGWAAGTHEGLPLFLGASLAALVALGRRRGYRYVGANRLGVNAFFVRAGLAPGLPSPALEEAFRHPKSVAARARRGPLVAGLPWVEV